MPASFPSSAKTFTTKNTSDTIDASHVNDLQLEVTAIEQCLLGSTALDAVLASVTTTGDIKTTAWTDYTATSTITGWTSFTAGRKFIMYKRVGKAVFVAFHLEGTSNSVNTSFTLPITAVSVGTVFAFGNVMPVVRDNGAVVATYGYCSLDNNTSTVNCYATSGGGAWTNSGTKIVSGQFWYEAA